MEDYKFTVSIIITHPSIDPAEITSVLGIQPDHMRKIGEPRMTPKGRRLDGVNRESLWRLSPQGVNKLSSNDILLEDYLEKLNTRFEIHREYFLDLRDSGGYLEYFVGWFGDTNIMMTLSPELLEQTSSLGVAIGLDIYVDG